MCFQFPLNVGGAAHGLDGARELGDHAVAGAAENPAVVACDQLVDGLTARAEGADRRFLVDLHEPAIPDHIGAHDGRKSTFAIPPWHGSAP